MKTCAHCRRLISTHSRHCIYCRSRDLIEVPRLQELERTSITEVSLNGQTYRIDGLIRKGGFGYIFQASHETKRVLFALKTPLVLGKIFGLSCGASDQQIEMSERMIAKEIETLTRFSHSNVISIYRRGTIDGTHRGREVTVPAFLMELGEGNVENLVYRMPNLALPERVQIIRDIADGGAYLHKRKVVYRDLSLKNVLVVDRETQGIHYVISDFGTAKKMDSYTQASLAGTARYTDPNYIRDPKTYHNDPRIDVYSLGIMTLELIMGIPDWTVLSDNAAVGMDFGILADLISEQRRSGRVPDAVAEVLARATASDASARFRDASEFSGAVDQALKKSGIASHSKPADREKTHIRFLSTIKLPLPSEEATYFCERQRFLPGEEIVLEDPRGVEVLLPYGYIKPVITKRMAPSFYEVYSPYPGALVIRFSKKLFENVIQGLTEVDHTLTGEMTFIGEVDIDEQ